MTVTWRLGEWRKRMEPWVESAQTDVDDILPADLQHHTHLGQGVWSDEVWSSKIDRQ